MTREDFAKAIVSMNYGTLRGIAAEFASMCEEKDVRPPPTTANDFAEMLFDWAEAQSKDCDPQPDQRSLEIVNLRNAIRWACGEAPDGNDQWFGDVMPETKEGERPKQYWWRSHLLKVAGLNQ